MYLYIFLYDVYDYIYFFNNVSHYRAKFLRVNDVYIYIYVRVRASFKRDNTSNQYTRSKDVKHAETRQKNPVVIQPLIKFELCLGCSRRFHASGAARLRHVTITPWNGDTPCHKFYFTICWLATRRGPATMEAPRELDLLHRVLYAFP